MAIYKDLHCQWCKATLGVDSKGDGQWLALREFVQHEEKFYCPDCYRDLQAMTKYVRRDRKGG